MSAAPRLVVVSNRVADPRRTAAGGLAVALGEALSASGGLWFGWSGNLTDTRRAGDTAQAAPRLQRAGRVTLATVDLSTEDHQAYYLGYANSVLWPAFHYRLDLARFDAGFLDGYRRVNRQFAQALAPLLREDDRVWVHDYHLMPLGAELRALGCRQRIGFFLHVPVPPPLVLAAVPAHEWLVHGLFAYDLVGLQSETDRVHLERFLLAEMGAVALDAHRYSAFGRQLEVRAIPIGIDVDEFAALVHSAEAREAQRALRAQAAKRHLLVGVDRLDYSKGLPQRFRAFRELLSRHAEDRGHATLVQIASPSRESVEAYEDLRHELDELAGAINGEFGDLDWTPLRYLRRTLSRKRLAGLYAASRVALVTPLRDGMNLVAKEFVAAQDPADPGVLVLSRFAGAAEQMADALRVNPYDIPATADAIQRALHMPLDERQHRHAALMDGLRAQDVHWWRRSFLEALDASV